MYVEIFKWIFIFICGILTLMLILLDRNITKHMKPMKASDFVSSITAMFAVYAFAALVLALILPGIAKLIMLLFAIFPFVAGRLANYKTKRYFTLAHILVIISCIIYVLRI